MIPTISLGLLGTAMLAFLPESPRFLVTKRRYQRARKAFNYISKMNGLGDRRGDTIIF